MTIKSLDFQVLLPKTQEVAKHMNNLKQHDPANQQHLAQKVQRELAEERNKVNNTQNTVNKRVKDKEKEGQEHKKGTKDQKESSKHEIKNKNESKVKDIAHLGQKVDIKI